jgi:hypothetical protein
MYWKYFNKVFEKLMKKYNCKVANVVPISVVKPSKP